MSHSVNWSDNALDSLALIWLTSSDPLRVTKAQHEVDRLLQSNPRVGHVNAEGLWFLMIPPLRILYEVLPPDDSVVVVTVNPC